MYVAYHESTHETIHEITHETKHATDLTMHACMYYGCMCSVCAGAWVASRMCTACCCWMKCLPEPWAQWTTTRTSRAPHRP